MNATRFPLSATRKSKSRLSFTGGGQRAAGSVNQEGLL